MKKILFPILAIVLAVGLALPMAMPATAADDNLVDNGSFEAPVITDYPSSPCENKNWQIFGSGGNGVHTTLLGWTVVASENATTDGPSWTAGGPGALEFQNANCGAGWHPYEGDQYAELDADVDGPCGTYSGEMGSVRIYQDLDTVAGGIYELSFAFAPRPDVVDNKLEVKWDGAEIADSPFVADGTDPAQRKWTRYTRTVTASGSTTRLEFADLSAPDALGTFLDDVEVVLIEIQVKIDIKPGSYPNSINLKSKGVVPVAVLTADSFDASTIDPDTVLFAGASPLRWTIEDVDNDGDMDMLFHFKTQELDLTKDSTDATLTGTTYDGTLVEGTDTVNIVPKGKGK